MRCFITLLATLVCACLLAQPTKGIIAPTDAPLSSEGHLDFPVLNNDSLLQLEMDNRVPGRAPKFAVSLPVDVRPDEHGQWEWLEDGRAVWRLRISSPGARSLNLGFTEYYMPPGGQMILYSPDGARLMGPFTPADNETHDQLWTPVFPEDQLILEVQLPASSIDLLRLRLTAVNHDFLGFMSVLSDPCHLDAICGEADGFPILDMYRDVIQSVAVIGQGGDTFCTGFLVNNTRNDCKPYFMTAYHCGINQFNASSVVAYWNYQNSFCRDPGSSASGSQGDGSLLTYNTGAFWRAGHQPTDFTLLELDDPVVTESDAYFTGWSRDLAASSDTVLCIHHPDGQEKRVTIGYQGVYPGQWGEGDLEIPGGNHLVVPDWEIGSTESGSSGAPLFNAQGRMIGQLHGGAASCANNLYDSFGWFRYAWNGGGSPLNRLKDWLDPDDIGLVYLDGHWLSSCEASLDIETSTVLSCSPGSAVFPIGISEFFPANVLLSVAGLPAGSTAHFVPNPAVPGSTSTLYLQIPPGLPEGSFDFTIQALSGNNQLSTEATVVVTNEVPSAPSNLHPAAESIGTSLAPSISWDALPGAVGYVVQVSQDSTFSSELIADEEVPSNQFQAPALAAYTTYYYRVRANNFCGVGMWSPPVRFTTSAIRCDSELPDALPMNIAGYANEYLTTSVNIDMGGTVASLRISNLDITHSYVGDLSAYLEAPTGEVVQLFHRPGSSYDTPYGCSRPDLLVSFTDEASLPYEDFKSSCSPGVAIEGEYQPEEPLNALVGVPADGEWTLIVIDHADGDGGQINNWELEICSTYPSTKEIFLDMSALACTDSSYSIPVFVGYGFSDVLSLSVFGLPAGISAAFEVEQVAPGEYTTLTLDGLSEAGDLSFVLVGEAVGEEAYIHHVPLTVDPSPVPSQLSHPENESAVFQGEINFTWSPVAGADHFLLLVSENANMEELVYTAQTDEVFHVLPEGTLESGIYYWSVVTSNTCGFAFSATHSFYKEGSLNSRDESLSASPQLIIYPNPTADYLYLDLSDPSPARAHLYTAQGQLVLTSDLVSTATLACDHLPAGVYWLRVEQAGRVMSRRVVIASGW